MCVSYSGINQINFIFSVIHKNGRECICTSSMNSLQPSYTTKCTMQCAGNSAYPCGSQDHVSAFHTGSPFMQVLDLLPQVRHSHTYRFNCLQLLAPVLPEPWSRSRNRQRVSLPSSKLLAPFHHPSVKPSSIYAGSRRHFRSLQLHCDLRLVYRLTRDRWLEQQQLPLIAAARGGEGSDGEMHSRLPFIAAMDYQMSS